MPRRTGTVAPFADATSHAVRDRIARASPPPGGRRRPALPAAGACWRRWPSGSAPAGCSCSCCATTARSPGTTRPPGRSSRGSSCPCSSLPEPPAGTLRRRALVAARAGAAPVVVAARCPRASPSPRSRTSRRSSRPASSPGRRRPAHLEPRRRRAARLRPARARRRSGSPAQADATARLRREPSCSARSALLSADACATSSALAGLEDELNSLSEQLANTYEELSLIYQISGGMKVNRRRRDFFQQTCLDVLEVMNVRGMGVALHADLFDQPRARPLRADGAAAAARRAPGDELMAVLRERKSPLLINDLAADHSLRLARAARPPTAGRPAAAAGAGARAACSRWTSTAAISTRSTASC